MLRRPSVNDDLITVDEFHRLVRDGQKADLLEGVIYMASPDSRRSNELTGFVDFLLRGYNRARKLGGKTFVTRFAFELTDIRSPEPDVAYVGRDRVHLVEEHGMRGGPDVAVEIVSRESRSRDYGEKRQTYQEAGVSEYWIIDPMQFRVEFLRLKEGRYEPVALENNRIFRSSVLPGFWLNVDWLLADPLPDEYDCLQEILASPPQP